MDKLLKFIIPIILFIITGCSSNDNPAIVKEEITGDKEKKSVTLVEETREEDPESKQMKIEFTLETEQLIIDLNQTPILKSYLSQINNKKKVIEQMTINKLDIATSKSLYILAFAESEGMHSYLLLDPDGEGRSYLLTDQANFLEIKQSPDGSKLLFNFERATEDQTWKTNKLIIMDLKKWQSISLINNDETVNLSVGEFKWPIFAFSWADDATVLLTLPLIEEPTTEELAQWFNSEQLTQQIPFSLK